MKTSYFTLTLASALMMLVTFSAMAQVGQTQYSRPMSSDGLTVFESDKSDQKAFDGLAIYWGAAFTQQFQMLSHENSGAVALYELGNGFNLATANLNLNAQLADGIQVNLVTYLSSRHHQEAWVKGGYLQVDNMKMLNNEMIDNLFKYLTVRAGHFEINYGDAHFRRTDNGNALYNPFVGNMIMDSFATEIGGEVMFQKDGIFGLVAITNGEIKGTVDDGSKRNPSFIGKVGFDRWMNDDLRVRISGSVYSSSKSLNNTLYSGDRAGSRYYEVMVEKAGDDFRNGRINPGFRSEVTAIQINPMVQFQNFELHGLYETATGQAANEAESRSFDQMAVDAIYRMNSLYLGARYNTVSGDIGGGNDVTVDRIQVGAGWFMTPNVLMKVNYTSQSYNDYPAGSIYEDGKFNGITIEGVVAF